MITSSYPKQPGDGTSPFIAYLAEGVAAERDCEVDVLLPAHPALARERDGARARLHPYRYAPTPAWSVWGYAASLTADRAIKPRILALVPITFVAGLLRARRLSLRRPPDLVHAHWVLPNGPLAAVIASMRRVPLVVSLHGSDLFLAERHPWLGWAARRVFRRAAQVVACSDNLRERAIRMGARAATTHTIPYGVDLERFRPDPASAAWLRARLGLAPEAPVVLAVGRLVGKKGFDVLLDAWAAVRERHVAAHLVIAGDGDLKDALVERARRLGIAHAVSFAGAVRHDEIARLYAGADVVAIPSVEDEGGNVDGLPNVLMEALAAGAAVVATRVGGIPQTVRDGENGLLIEPRDTAALAGALGRLLADPALTRRLGAGARAGSERAQGWAATVRAHLAVYRAALAAAPAGATHGAGIAPRASDA